MAYGQENPKPPKKPAPKEQRGGDENPITVKVLPGPNAKAETDHYKGEAKYWEKRVAGEHRIGTATIWVAALTLGLVLVTGGLWRATYRLYQEGHRPMIRTKHVYITSDVWGNKPIEIKLVVVNVGLGPAIINAMNMRAVILPDGVKLPPREEYPEGHKRVSIDELTSGITIALPAFTTIQLSLEDHPRLMDGSKKLWCHGFVEYLDREKRMRKTAFCRVWEPPNGVGALGAPGRFVKVEDPDYEYQD